MKPTHTLLDQPMGKICAASVGLDAQADLPLDAGGFVDALMATGMSLGAAMAQAVGLMGEEAVRPVFMDAMESRTTGRAVMDTLGDVALGAPQAADAWLNALLAEGRVYAWHENNVLGFHFTDLPWLTRLPMHLPMERGAWLCLNGCANLAYLPEECRPASFVMGQCPAIRAIPPGLQVQHSMILRRCASLESLPDGLDVPGDLYLTDCVALVALPKDLRVGQSMDLLGCLAWDGRIPHDVQLHGCVYTVRHDRPMTLDVWRDKYPHGCKKGV